MKAWKMVNLRDADVVAAGSVRLGTFRSFKELENGRRDEREGTLTRGILGYEKVDINIPGSWERAARAGADFGPNAINCEVGEVTTTWELAPLWMYCMTVPGNLYDQTPEEPKAVFEIADVGDFIDAVAQAHRIAIASFQVQRVSYLPITVDVDDDPSRRASPFVKDPHFQPEQELRAVFFPRFRPRERDDLRPITSPPSRRIAKLLSRVR